MENGKLEKTDVLEITVMKKRCREKDKNGKHHRENTAGSGEYYGGPTCQRALNTVKMGKDVGSRSTWGPRRDGP